jgi:hypothetical protein
MLADPKLRAVICGCTAGVVWPAVIVTDDGETVTFVGSLLAKVTVMSVGAWPVKLTGKATGWFSGALVLAGTVIAPRATTDTLAVVSARFGRALAWIVDIPAPTPVTATLTLVAPVGKTTVDGTVATAVFPELRFITSPAGAGADKLRVRFFVTFLAMVKVGGAKLSPEITVMVSPAPMKPGDVAVMVTDPKPTPVTRGCVAGIVAS